MMDPQISSTSNRKYGWVLSWFAAPVSNLHAYYHIIYPIIDPRLQWRVLCQSVKRKTDQAISEPLIRLRCTVNNTTVLCGFGILQNLTSWHIWDLLNIYIYIYSLFNIINRIFKQNRSSVVEAISAIIYL